MAELLAILGALVALEIIFPCILITWRRLFPISVERARLRLDYTPWQCFWLGCVAAIISLPPIAVLLVLPLELTRIAGCFLLFVVMAFAGLGATGLATKIGKRLTPQSNNGMLPAPAPVRRGLAHELAVGLWLGGVITVIVLPAIAILLDLSLDLTWLVGWALCFVAVAIAALFATISADRSNIQLESSNNPSTLSAFMRGAVVLELAVGLPIIGWFIVFPIAFITSLGASVFALLRWMPLVLTPVAYGSSIIRRAVVSSVVFLWVLPFIAISLSVVAFLVRGAIVLESASSLPVIGWIIIIPIYIVILLGGTVFALLRWGRWWRRPVSAEAQE